MCLNDTDPNLYQNNSIYDVDQNSKIFADHFSTSVFRRCTGMVNREIYHHSPPSLVMHLTDASTGNPAVLLQTGCPDCMAVKSEADVPFFMLLSKEKKTMICFVFNEQLLVVVIFRWMGGETDLHTEKYTDFKTLASLMCPFTHRQKTVSV